MGSIDLSALMFTIATWAIPVLIAIPLHEAAHGYAAWRLGDPTAKSLGRVTMNPLVHVSPFGTLILPLLLIVTGAPFLFGWAKPVPVDYRNLRNPKTDMAWVALAGPGINLFLAFISVVLLRILAFIGEDPTGGFLVEMLQKSMLLNVILAVFNMIPVPPLDGGRVLVGVLPMRMAIAVARFERFGLFALIGILFLAPLLASEAGYAFNPFAEFIQPVIIAVMQALFGMVGLL